MVVAQVAYLRLKGGTEMNLQIYQAELLLWALNSSPEMILWVWSWVCP